MNTRIKFLSLVLMLVVCAAPQAHSSVKKVKAKSFVPVKGDEIPTVKSKSLDISPSEPLIKKVEEQSKPKSAAELDSIDKSFQTYSVEQAGKLGFAFGTLEESANRRFCVKNFVMYKQFEEGDVKVWYGVGIRWVLNVKLVDTTANIGAVPYIAASATYKKVEVSSWFQIIGLNNPKITEIAAGTRDNFDVESYSEMAATFKQLSELIHDKNTKVTPVVVGRVVIDNETEEEYGNALIQIWALQKISERKTLSIARESFPNATSAEKATIQNVYGFILGNDHLNDIPKQVAVERAKELMRGLKLKT